ncbi:MAG: PEP-CTERM sorting domain-containing protein, partial [bacterium]|nr:PEP-CTERM sorting domain-containing protein [bacterium]
TTAYLTMTFANPFEVNLSSIWLKMQRVGPNENSFEMNGVPQEHPQVPEPGTMFLLGSLATGLFGFAGLRKRFTR